jgi:preprotein translocase subunit YajC
MLAFVGIIISVNFSGGYMSFSIVSTAYAMGAPMGGGHENMLTSFMPFILIFVVFYFLLIRPQQKNQKEHQKMLEGLKKGDAVITAGGLLGRIIEVKEDVMIVDLGETKVNVPRGYLNPAPQKKQGVPSPKKEKKGKKDAKEAAPPAAETDQAPEVPAVETPAVDAPEVVSGDDKDKPAVQ